MGGFAFSDWRKAAAGAAALCVLAVPAHAQVTNNYVDTNSGTLSSAATPCTNALVRTINVPDSMTITDVDVGMIIDHNNRGDTAAAIRHPDGTQVLLFYRTGGTLNDYNVLFDQAAASQVDAAPQNVNNNVAAAPYQFTVRPRNGNTLNNFNGKPSQGNWLFLACDASNNGVNGTYLRSELIITGTQNFADLRLDMSASSLSPTYGSNVTMTLTVTHETGTLSTNGVAVTYQLPTGLNFMSASGAGTYNSGTGVWTIGTLNPGGSATINIVAEVLTTGLYGNIAEITASSTADPDSTPGNAGSNPSEDDTSGLTLTPGSSGGTGPSGEPLLSCALPAVFDWDSNPWAYNAAVLSRSYPGGGSDGTDFTISVSGDTGFRDTNSPSTNTSMTGGLSPAQQSLYYFQNLSSTTQSVNFTIDVGAPGTGVQDFQFTLFDIDYAAGQFRDRIAVTGSLGGVAVSPVLTPGSANSATGSVAVGINGAASTSATGSLIVTFLSPVDRIAINYSNPEASAGTSNQAMSLHDFNYCPRATDFGDIALTYGAASHLITSGYYIGATAPDGEASTQVSVNADGDDIAGADDEDTIDFSSLIAGMPGSLNVDVTGSGGFLQMWIDWNGDGDFNDTVDGVSEQVATNVTIAGSSGTVALPITVPAGATLSPTKARLRWSSQSGLGPSGSATSGEVEDHSLTIQGAAALQGAKTMSIYDPAGAGLYALPGNDVIYEITVSNAGFGPTDVDSVVLIDKVPAEVEFWNGDIDTGGPDTYAGTDPVGFSQANGAALTFTYGSDVAFSTAATAPANFAACTAIAPDNTYRPDITYICFNPKGALASGDPDPQFTVSFRARIK